MLLQDLETGHKMGYLQPGMFLAQYLHVVISLCWQGTFRWFPHLHALFSLMQMPTTG